MCGVYLKSRKARAKLSNQLGIQRLTDDFSAIREKVQYGSKSKI